MKRLSSLFRFKIRPIRFALTIITATLFGLLQHAQAQPTNLIKWDQPPAPATNVFYGWNQKSVCGVAIAADDWVCTNNQPVTKIRWWGSFIGWAQTNPPPILPLFWRINIWTDTPKFTDAPWSHPSNVVHQIITANVPFRCVGLDYHHDDGNCPVKTPSPSDIETCYQWDLDLSTDQYFHQEQYGPSNVFWVTISACYDLQDPPYPFGIKTRRYNPSSPDCAVISTDTSTVIPPGLGGPFLGSFPITCPGPYSPTFTNNWWDLAFELYTGTGHGVPYFKWEQLPDLSTNGIDVRATVDTGSPPPFLLADDFLCTQTGYITNIVIWGSWRFDRLPHNAQFIQGASNVIFTLSLHEDYPDPDFTGPLFSKPTNYVWSDTFTNGTGPMTFTTSLEASDIREGFMTPPSALISSSVPGDTNCYKYEFNIPPGQLLQQGTAANPKVYWLDVQATFPVPQTNGPAIRPQFGWKTSTNHWNDDAVWATAIEPVPPTFTAWNELRYPAGHPYGGQSIDLAFRINGGGTAGQTIKWSQPPILYQNPTNFFNGWNEPSIYQGGYSQQYGFLTNIVADDWLCTNSRAVSDIHWWGSFLDWQGTNLPTGTPLFGFHIAFWKDVPAGVDTTFSHPDTVEKAYFVPLGDPNFTGEWVGWDVDPRSDCPKVETCFKFNYKIQDTNEWFRQQGPSNIYWVSIAAVYPIGQPIYYPFGWKTRPHVPVPPDDAVRIFNPLAPVVGSPYIYGEPIEYPAGRSWDMAFQLTTCQQLPLTNIVITNITVTNITGNQVINIWWNSQPGYYYQMQEALLMTNPPLVWANISPIISGPLGQYTFTNPAVFQRYYRVALPNLCP